jgi:hypothetical protein
VERHPRKVPGRATGQHDTHRALRMPEAATDDRTPVAMQGAARPVLRVATQVRRDRAGRMCSRAGYPDPPMRAAREPTLAHPPRAGQVGPATVQAGPAIAQATAGRKVHDRPSIARLPPVGGSIGRPTPAP